MFVITYCRTFKNHRVFSFYLMLCLYLLPVIFCCCCRWPCAVAFLPATWGTSSSGATTRPPSTLTCITAWSTCPAVSWPASRPSRTTPGSKESSSLWVKGETRCTGHRNNTNKHWVRVRVLISRYAPCADGAAERRCSHQGQEAVQRHVCSQGYLRSYEGHMVRNLSGRCLSFSLGNKMMLFL